MYFVCIDFRDLVLVSQTMTVDMVGVDVGDVANTQ